MIDDLQKLLAFRTVSSDQAAVGALLDSVQGRLESKGLTVERIEHNAVQSLYASTTGKHHTKVLLQGHIDVVPDGQPFSQIGDRIEGRGCYDMLFATAAFLRLIDEMDTTSNYDVGILLTGDEELGGINGVGAILDDGYLSCDVCILPDAGEGLGTLNVAAKGTFHAQIEVSGRSHHGSRPWEGDGAAAKMVKLLHELSDAFDDSDHANSTLTISQLQSGSSALNQGPSVAKAGFDIRPKDEADAIRIREIVDGILQKYDGKITHQDVGRSYELDASNPLVQSFVKIYAESVGKDIAFIKAHGSSDARFFDAKGMPVIMLRPDGGGAHGDDEWLSAQSFEQFYQILKRYVITTTEINKV